MASEIQAGAGTVVMVPTYNERDNVASILGGLCAAVPKAHVLVIDDNSPDGTGDLVESMRREQPGLELLRRPGKEGLGVAYRDGMRWCLARGYERVVHMDADMSHSPSVVPKLLETSEGCDLAIASRYIRGSRIVGWPLKRRVISRSANLYAKTMLRLPVNDMTGGFKCWRADVLSALGVETFNASGYVFLVEMTWRAVRAGFTVREVPFEFRERERGVSKMNLQLAGEGFRQVLRWSRQKVTAEEAGKAAAVRAARSGGGAVRVG